MRNWAFLVALVWVSGCNPFECTPVEYPLGTTIERITELSSTEIVCAEAGCQERSCFEGECSPWMPRSRVNAQSSATYGAEDYGSSSGGPVHVRGYTRRDGTYVRGYTRRR